MIKLTINGQKITAEDGMSILDAALAHGIEIPALCHDPDLKPESSCRLCLVEVDGRPWPRVACGTPVRDGMVVETNTPEIREIRRDILQLLLDNHPNDCLTCQKAGECLLQKYAYEYGVTFRTHECARRGGERARFTDTSSPYILRDESKCILCGKCISTCAELNERSVLSFAGRGFETKVAADRDETLEASTCVSCGRCVAVCHVGALIDRLVREKKIRPWEADRQTIQCKACEYGCEYEVLEKGSERVIRPLSPSEGRPLCLKGRLFVEAEVSSELRTPYKKEETEKGRKFVRTTWIEALELDGILDRIAHTESESDK